METMFARSDWVLATLAAITKKQIARSDINQSQLVRLKDHRDPRIQRLARQLLQNSTPRRQEVVDAYQSSLQMKGNADRGKAIFKTNCSACHKMDGVGKSVGADLIGIGNRPLETILTDILDPNRVVKSKFINCVLVTKDGRTVVGMIVAETANSIRLARADGTDANVLRIRIESLRSTGLSLMPEGLEKHISPQAMADLLAYLATFK